MKNLRKYWDIIFVIGALFYCVPFGGVSLGGEDSDFRIYDFALWVFILYNYKYLRERFSLTVISENKKRVFLLLGAFLIGAVVAIILKGSALYLVIILVRISRMVAYLLFFLILTMRINTQTELKVLINTFYSLGVLNAIVAVLQSRGILPYFWPAKWLGNYGFLSWPTAFLSPHHLQIGVVMILVCGLSMYYLLSGRTLLKFFHIGVTILSIYVIFLNDSRTGIFFSVIICLISLLKMKEANATILIFPLAIFIIFNYFGNFVNFFEQTYDRIVVTQIEGKGSLSDRRGDIYTKDIPNILTNYPWVLITGAGFQNYKMVSSYSNAGHNNYVQYLIELGIFGLFSFIYFLYYIYKCVTFNDRLKNFPGLKQIIYLNNFSYAALITLCGIMLFNEIIYPQYAIFTLPAQVLTILAIPVIISKMIQIKIRETRLS